MRRSCSLALIAVLSISCGSKTATPTSPSPTVTQTRIIALGGNMDFGSIQINQSFSATMNIRNNGTAPLNISGITGSSSITSVLKTNWSSGAIAPSASQDVLFTFTPTAPQAYSGTITVNGDQTSGTNTLAFSGTGNLNGLPVFTKSGSGDQVFDLPAYVTKIRVQGSTTTSCQNFVVKVAGRLVVNVILGTCSVADAKTIDNTYVITGGGTVETQLSTGVTWTISESR